MLADDLLVGNDCWRMTSLAVEPDGSVMMSVVPSTVSATCPVCRTRTARRHTWYRRTALDLPWRKFTVRLRIWARRFFCDARRSDYVNQGASARARSRFRVLFLCTHNSARSQMAEGLLRSMDGERFEVFSAGTEATFVRPLAVRTMAEVGIDISGHQRKTLERFLDQQFDAVITVCDQANEACPVFGGAKTRLHWSFPDPSRGTGTDEEQLAVYRQVRDAIRQRIDLEMHP